MKTLDEVKAAIRTLTPAELRELKKEIDESLSVAAQEQTTASLNGSETRAERVKAAEDFVFSNYKELLTKLAK